jgi:photoactive yellow protein
MLCQSLSMGFDDADLLRSLDRSEAADLDGLPFGVIKMTVGGKILAYNAPESRLSGLSPDLTVGKGFFTEVAPCTNNHMVAERLLGADSLDATIDYVFAFKMRPVPVRLRMLRQGSAPHMYLLVQPRA